MKQDKKFLLVQFFTDLKAGLNLIQIAKKYKISKQNLNYYVGKLKKAGCIEKKGYGVWEVLKEVKDLTIGRLPSQNKYKDKSKQIRGHAFIWKVEFYNKIDWEEAIKVNKFPYNTICYEKVYRILFKNRKIWLTSKGLIIYEPIDFLGRSSFQVKGTAIFEMDLLIKALLKKLKIKFQPYKFTTSREHYGIMKNELARQYNDKKEKLHIKGEDGDIWLWIDDSLSLGELENKEPVVNRQVQNWFNDHKKHNFEVTPTFTLQALKKVSENQLMFDKNFQSHLVVIKQLGEGVNKYTDAIELLVKAIENINRKQN